MVLCDQEKELRQQLLEKQESLKNVRPPTAKMRRDQQEIKVLENRCEQVATKLNDLQAVNKNLRKKIDVQRKQLAKQKIVNKGYSREINQTVEEIKKLNSKI